MPIVVAGSAGRPVQRRLDVKPIAEEIAAAIIAGQPDDRLKWVGEDHVRLLIGKGLPASSAVKETFAGRRKRLRDAGVIPLLAGKCLKRTSSRKRDRATKKENVMNNMSNEGVPQDTMTASTTVEWSDLEEKMLAEVKDVHGIRRCAEALRVSAQDMEDLANMIGDSTARIWTDDGIIFVSASPELVRRLVAEGLLFFPDDDDGSPAGATDAGPA